MSHQEPSQRELAVVAVGLITGASDRQIKRALRESLGRDVSIPNVRRWRPRARPLADAIARKRVLDGR